MSWASAAARALLIVAYFAVASVWLPSAVLRVGAVTRAGETLQGLLGSGVWLAAMAAGMWMLRTAQRKGRI